MILVSPENVAEDGDEQVEAGEFHCFISPLRLDCLQIGIKQVVCQAESLMIWVVWATE